VNAKVINLFYSPIVLNKKLTKKQKQYEFHTALFSLEF